MGLTTLPKAELEHDRPAENAARAVSIPAILLFVGVMLIAVAESCHPCPAFDTWWQLRAGSDILASHHLPHTDSYSWTHYGAHWAAIEWLSFVLEWSSLVTAGGYIGLLVLQALIMLVTTALIWIRIITQTQRPYFAFLWCAVFAVSMATYIQPRPVMFSYLLEAVLCYLLTISTSRSQPMRFLIRVAILFILWANLHQGVVVGVAILGVMAVGRTAANRFADKIDWIDDKELPGASILWIATIVAAICSFATPYGPDLVTNIFVTLNSKSAMTGVTEWRSFFANFHTVHDCAAAVLMVAALAAVAFRRTRPSLPIILVLAALLAEGLMHYRNVPLFLVAASVLSAPRLGTIDWPFARRAPAAKVQSPSRWAGTLPALATVVIAVAIATVFAARELGPIDSGPNRPEGVALTVFEAEYFPESAISFIENEKFPTDMRFYNDYNLGDYMILRLPSYKVFVDGRADIYVGSFLDSEMHLYRIRQIDDRSNMFLQSFDFDTVITEVPVVATYYYTDPQWTLVYATSNRPISAKSRNQWIFVRNRQEYIPLIKQCLADWSSQNGGVRPEFSRIRSP